jgi:cobalt-zinc-cadmium efflux system outer membrane protein
VLSAIVLQESYVIGFPKFWNAGLRAWVSCAVIATGLCGAAFGVEPHTRPPAGAGTLRLTVDEATALFLKQNLDLLIAQYGIDAARGLEVTARLFPNPVLSLDATTSTTRSIDRTGSLTARVDQLFELAGKRAYRQESARYATQSAEAAFGDTVRVLGFSVKEAFYKVLQARQRLELAKENSAFFDEVVKINSIRFRKGVIAEADLIKLRVQSVDFQNQVITATHDLLAAQNNLRALLALRPSVELQLQGQLEYKPVTLVSEALIADALANRPDLVAKERTVSQRLAELKLAKAFRVPDVSVGVDKSFQGPEGPNSPNQIGAGISVPLPLFNRNQGGILQAEAGIKAAEADRDKTRVQVEIDVEAAYRDFSQTQMLLQAYRAGVLEDARASREIAKKAYERGGTTILDVLDAFRTFNATMQGYLEALLAYQRSLLAINSAVGREVIP